MPFGRLSELTLQSRVLRPNICGPEGRGHGHSEGNPALSYAQKVIIYSHALIVARGAHALWTCAWGGRESDSDGDLRWWADRVRDWQGIGRDVFVYFNNDGGGNAVRNALDLKGMVEA